jgi:hypothetical protein
MGAVVPIVTGGIGIYSAIKNSRAAGRQSKLMEQAQQQGMGTFGDVRRQGRGLFEQGMPATQNALNYYSTLLRGNRAAMQLATAGPRAQLTDTYRGAEQGLKRMGVRGGERQTALAELSRDRANAIAQLTTGQQSEAARGLGLMGLSLTGQGVGAQLGAGEGFGNIARQSGEQATEYGKGARADWQGVGKSLKELADWWNNRKPKVPLGGGPGGTTGKVGPPGTPENDIPIYPPYSGQPVNPDFTQTPRLPPPQTGEGDARLIGYRDAQGRLISNPQYQQPDYDPWHHWTPGQYYDPYYGGGYQPYDPQNPQYQL